MLFKTKKSSWFSRNKPAFKQEKESKFQEKEEAFKEDTNDDDMKKLDEDIARNENMFKEQEKKYV
jgi:hypothetical protein